MRALVTGVTGQDGRYLAELLLSKGYTVGGLYRRSSMDRPGVPNVQRFVGDLSDSASLNKAVRDFYPTEVYNLAAQSHVRESFETPEYTADVDGLGVLRLLEAVRAHAPKARFYQASTSEQFGGSVAPLNEASPFNPRSPYACAKVFAHQTVRNYREGYGMWACSGILFNHESPRRSAEFVTRKVTRAAARIASGFSERLALGNLDARRDWGFAGDYVEAMWRMVRSERPQDYVIATGITHSIRELLDMAFSHVGLRWREHVDYDPRLCRPTEVDCLIGDASKAKRDLGWEPKVDFRTLIRLMVDADLKELS